VYILLFFKHKRNEQSTNGDIEPASGGDNKPIWGQSRLGSLYEEWPKKDGVPEDPVFIKHCSSVDMEDEMLVNMLSAFGIPAVKQYPANGGFGKIVIGMSGEGTDIFVPTSMLNDALSVIGGQSNE
jgi:hypothetical protein